MPDNEWETKPDSPGYFKRRIRFFRIQLEEIRVIRWHGSLIWNLAAEKRGFKFFRPSWRDLFLEYQRFNGVDHLP